MGRLPALPRLAAPTMMVQPPALPPLARLLRAYLRTPLRGRTRLTSLVAERVPALQRLPIGSDARYPVFIDLRDPGDHELLRDAPHSLDTWEPTTHEVMRHFIRPGDVVLDVGANRGIYLARLAREVGPTGHVYAFEPNPAHAAALRQAAAVAGCATVLPYALSDAPGEARFFVPQNHEMASLGRWQDEDAPSVTCEMARLDDLVAAGSVRQPRFIKMDIEGAECRALHGARAVLDRDDAPVIIFESNVFASPTVSGVPACATAEFLASLERARYALFVVFPWGLLLPLHPSQLVHENVLAVPASRLGEWPALSDEPFVRLRM